MSNETVWLDALPHEVCARIAANATQSDPDAVLRMGRVSPTLRAAVIHSLHRLYTFNQARISSYADRYSRPESSDHEHASAPEHTPASEPSASEPSASEPSASDHHLHSPDDSVSEPAEASSDHTESSPHVSDGEQPVPESGPSAPDSQLPHPPDEYPDLKAALQHMLRAQFGDNASDWTIKEAATMEEFWAKCQDDDQSSHHSVEVHSNQAATDQPADEVSHQSLHPPNEEQSGHEADPAHSENRSEDENRSDEGEETSQSNENHSSCENDSDVEAETSLLSDAERPLEQETPQVPESMAKFHMEFAEFLGEDIRSMFVCALVPELRSQPAFQTCMASPLLEELVLGIPSDVYESFRVGPNLRKLTVMVAKDDLPVIPYLQLLSSTSVRELHAIVDSSVCLHKYLTRDPETASLLSSWFPNVEKLDLQCHACNTLEDSPAPMWSIMKHFGELKSITLSEPVPEDAIEEFRRIESVSLHGEKMRDLPERIPDRIVDIVTNDQWMNGIVGKWNLCETQLERLGNCSRLERLNCCIKPGMERELVHVVGNLTSLGIAFDASGTPVGEKLIPLRPSEGAILDLVRAAPSLKSLRLVNMRISRGELQEVLISAGDRLEEFQEVVFVNSFMGQFEHQNSSFKFPKSENKQELELFVAILRTAAVHNPRLTELSIDLRPEWFTDIRAVQSILEKLRAACLVLIRRAISLNYLELGELFEKFCNGEIGSVHLLQSLCGDLGIPVVAVG